MRSTRYSPESATDLAVRWNCRRGKCGSCSAEINGSPACWCMTRLSDLDLDKPVTVEPMRAFPPVRESGHRRRIELSGEKAHQKVHTETPDAADGTWRMDQADADRVQEFRSASNAFSVRTSATCCAITTARGIRRAAIAGARRAARDESARRSRPHDRSQGINGIGYCNITKCCTKVCRSTSRSPITPLFPSRKRVVGPALRSAGKLVGLLRGRKREPEPETR